MTPSSSYALSLQAWRTGLSLWQAGLDIQMSMVRGLYGIASSGDGDRTDMPEAEVEAPGVDFAKRAAQSIDATARPAQAGKLPV